MFKPLRVMSDYSLMKSMIKMPSLINYLKNNKIDVCGISDENLFSVMEFYTSCINNNIKPLIGLQVVVSDVLLSIYAKDNDGYKGLLKIHTKKETGQLSVLDIERFSEHLCIILSYDDIAFYKELSKICRDVYVSYKSEYEKNNSLVVTDKIIFAPLLKCIKKSDGELINLLEAIDKNALLSDVEKRDYSSNSFEEYEHYEVVDDKTEEFINKCNVSIDFNKRYIPVYDDDKDSGKFLSALAHKGLLKRLNNKVSSEYAKRLEYELSVIDKMGFNDYFLIVYDYVKYAKQNGILVGVGRGSAVGSLVSYSLGITEVDPLKYNLLFERFLNPERVTMPDIDIDFEESRREEVVNYVKKKYGVNSVASIMTFGTLKSKLVIKSVGKALGYDNKLVDDFASIIDAKLTLDENLENESIKKWLKNREVSNLVSICKRLEGLKKHISTHAAGIVISSVELDEVIPVHYNGHDLQTGVTMNYLEDLGLLKMDFLSLRNLTTLGNILKLIESSTGKSININRIPLEDKGVLDMFSKGDTLGVFQFESVGMTNFLKKLKPSTFSDLIAAIALFRPGPMENIDTFIRRKEGKEKITYLHPSLESILKETYGIIVYQEQVMQILVSLGGFSFAEADLIRRGISKKKKEIIESGKKDFINGALKKGIDENVALNIYLLIEKFANYGFNKSHSVSYAIIGYQMAYLKCYYKEYYVANLLNMNIDSIIKTKEYMALLKSYNIKVLAPDINKSEMDYVVSGKTVRIPFGVIKNLGLEASRSIIMNRVTPYTDIFDFCARTYGKSINKKTLEALIKSGCFDSFGDTRKSLMGVLDYAINYATLASDLDESLIEKPTIKKETEYSLEELRSQELDSFGFYISNHPSSIYQESRIMKLNRLVECYNKFVMCVVLIDRIKKIDTKNGSKMAFIDASDETSHATFVAFGIESGILQDIKEGDLVTITGRVAKRFADYQINIKEIKKTTRKD